MSVSRTNLQTFSLEGSAVGCPSKHKMSQIELLMGNMLCLLAKVPVFKCQKMALRTPKSKNGLQKPRETPPKMVE